MNKITLLLLDSNFQTIKVLDDFNSFIWTDRFRDVGDFEYYVMSSSDIFSQMKLGYYLWLKESEHMMIIYY